jgi:alpha-tubulin suppressor-like RCC1 family protein
MKFIRAVLIFFLSHHFLFAQIVDGGNGHSIILDKKGNVWTIGRNDFGQLGDSSLKNSSIPKKVKGLKNIVAISRGYDHCIALDSKGNLFLWGRNNYGQIGCTSVNDQWVPQKLQNPVLVAFLSS